VRLDVEDREALTRLASFGLAWALRIAAVVFVLLAVAAGAGLAARPLEAAAR
jgi:hypothetical protein